MPLGKPLGEAFAEFGPAVAAASIAQVHFATLRGGPFDGREVAVKVLSRDTSEDSQFRPRFEREAKVLASLNHPNIAAIYGLEEEEIKHFARQKVCLARDSVSMYNGHLYAPKYSVKKVNADNFARNNIFIYVFLRFQFSRWRKTSQMYRHVDW